MTDQEIIDRQQETIRILTVMLSDTLRELRQFRAVEEEENRLDELIKQGIEE